MKKILSLIICVLLGLQISVEARYPINPTIVDKNDFTVDEVFMLSTEEEECINEKLLHMREKTGVEMAVVIIGSMDGKDISTYSVGLFNEWGIGDKDKNNGLLFLICKNTREMRLTTGIGLEKKLPDSKVKAILDKKFLPAMRQGNTAKGIEDVIDAICDIVRN